MNELSQEKPGRFGTFGGVFTPCTLTILGVIMFLRFGYVVGQSGVFVGVGIVLAANAISLLTSLSLSAIATNTKLEGGGAYYLISRSLGVEFGGAIGVVFYIAQAISVAMYVIGFAEAFVGLFPTLPYTVAEVATALNLVVFVCVTIGAGWTIKVQYLILAILGASILSFFVGAGQSFSVPLLKANLTPHFSDGHNSFTMFALFFPAVTGIMAGANMSGDLRDPARSIPRGTLLAVVVTMLVFLSQVVFLGASRSAEELVGNNLIIGEIAAWPVLISVGVFAATLSSALGSMMGAPRILQAFARDNVLRSLKYFERGSGTNDEPRRAIVLTFVVAQACILLADLNTIAPIITMAFLVTYGLINLATFYEGITKNPSYRPRFRYCHWSLSLVGAAGCLVVMFLISPMWATVAIVLMAALHWYIAFQEIEARWGDLQSGWLFERARNALLRLEDEMHHPKNWRPMILALSGAGWSRVYLAVYGHWFAAGRGILTLGQVIQGELEDRIERRKNQERLLDQFISEEELQAFPAVVVAPTVPEGIETLVQCHGLGTLRPNTVLLGWPDSPEGSEAFAATLRTVASLDQSVIAIRMPEDPADPWKPPKGSLDVWWRAGENGEMMLLLAHLLTQNPEWRNRPIRLMRVIPDEAGREEVTRHLETLIDKARIAATPHVFVCDDVRNTILRESENSALVFIGLEPPKEGDERAFLERIDELVADLPRLVMVDSGGGMSLES